MKKIITYGTFDLLHPGHIRLLKRARELGDHLTVGLSTDQFNRLKHKQAILSYDQRKEIIESIKYVDSVIPEDNWEQKTKDIKENDINIFVMGNDWDGKFDYLNDYCKVIYLERTENISTTHLKQKISNGKINN